MGNQNVQKAAIKRARNQAKEAAKKGGNSIVNNKDHQAKAATFKCKTCMQTFAVTTKRPELLQHVENKHKGKAPEECFENLPSA